MSYISPPPAYQPPACLRVATVPSAPNAGLMYPDAWNNTKKQKFRDLCSLYEINEYYSMELRRVLCAPIKVFIVDNSGSMNHILRETHLRLVRPVRRYDELIEFIKIAIPLMSIDSAEGVTIVFLNPPLIDGKYIYTGIHDWSQIAHVFQAPPRGTTPLVERLREQLATVTCVAQEQGALFLIFTDGEPDGGPDALYRLIKHRPNPFKVICNFLVCTDNDDEVAYLNKLDRKAKGVDVCDDYISESKEVRHARPGASFTFGDYVVKACVGGACKKFDEMDEKRCMCTLL